MWLQWKPQPFLWGALPLGCMWLHQWSYAPDWVQCRRCDFSLLLSVCQFWVSLMSFSKGEASSSSYSILTLSSFCLIYHLKTLASFWDPMWNVWCMELGSNWERMGYSLLQPIFIVSALSSVQSFGGPETQKLYVQSTAIGGYQNICTESCGRTKKVRSIL